LIAPLTIGGATELLKRYGRVYWRVASNTTSHASRQLGNRTPSSDNALMPLPDRLYTKPDNDDVRRAECSR
jgi:hypothetical protein